MFAARSEKLPEVVLGLKAKYRVRVVARKNLLIVDRRLYAAREHRHVSVGLLHVPGDIEEHAGRRLEHVADTDMHPLGLDGLVDQRLPELARVLTVLPEAAPFQQFVIQIKHN